MTGPTDEDLQRGCDLLNLAEERYGRALAALDFDVADSWAQLAFYVIAETRRARQEGRRPWNLADAALGGAPDG